MLRLIRNVVIEDDSGQGLVEYALILLLVAIVAYAALTTLGINISTALANIATDV